MTARNRRMGPTRMPSSFSMVMSTARTNTMKAITIQRQSFSMSSIFHRSNDLARRATKGELVRSSLALASRVGLGSASLARAVQRFDVDALELQRVAMLLQADGALGRDALH